MYKSVECNRMIDFAILLLCALVLRGFLGRWSSGICAHAWFNAALEAFKKKRCPMSQLDCERCAFKFRVLCSAIGYLHCHATRIARSKVSTADRDILQDPCNFYSKQYRQELVKETITSVVFVAKTTSVHTVGGEDRATIVDTIEVVDSDTDYDVLMCDQPLRFENSGEELPCTTRWVTRSKRGARTCMMHVFRKKFGTLLPNRAASACGAPQTFVLIALQSSQSCLDKP